MTDSQTMLVVFAYDSDDDRRRRKIARMLDDFADRVQYSVFEGWLNEAQLQQALRRVAPVLDPAHDKLRVYRLCAYCRSASSSIGPSPIQPLPDFWLV